ncbi:hypothetical protein DS884_17875 [Tenacibaculum sp. E3R01]|uniref:hypothetical protein n=1 Tax=Tenacibaculum sp. E3R01 TaxID=2267227 RepID=UPI000DE8829C|nr:hypothetical protein [Tenacibaculum sp. E3R01]RBW54316.1 hypothetical protein DS884_17875 [Tenacibaculum sp. E3R01]
MNKITPLFLALTLIFASCSSTENDAELLQKNETKLKSYTLKRDANGRYSIDFDVKENTEVNTFKNSDKSNEIVLSEAVQKQAQKHSNNFNLENDFLKIGFLEDNNGKKTQITVEDENITFAKKGVTEFLNNYSVTKNEDGTFTLDFQVNNNVQTEFIYNELKEIYEVHLSIGLCKNTKFIRTLNVSSSKQLKIDFVNHKFNKNKMARTSESSTRKPKVHIGNELASLDFES